MSMQIWQTIIDMVLDTLKTMAMFWLLKVSVAVAQDSGINIPGVFPLVLAA